MSHLIFELKALKFPEEDEVWKKSRNLKFLKIHEVRNEEMVKEILENSPYKYTHEKRWKFKVTVTEGSANDIRRIRTTSAGFAGYQWFIDSIIKKGRIER